MQFPESSPCTFVETRRAFSLSLINVIHPNRYTPTAGSTQHQVPGWQTNCMLTPQSLNCWKVGVIFGIPLEDSEEDILLALTDQQVSHVKRLPIRNVPGSRSSTVLLTFATTVPDKIKIASISYPVQISVPNPYRCRNCWRLGYTANRGNANGPNCKKCGKQHEAGQECSTRCITCHMDDHEAG